MTQSHESPLVTVLVDTYNHEHFIEKALDSVLEQDFDMSCVEIIVIDDGSTDETSARLARYSDRVHVVRKANGGQASAFNAGIPLARGEFIAFLDGDDWWRSEKLTKVVTLLQSRPDVGFVGSAIMETDGCEKERLVAPSAREEFQLDSASGAALLMAHRCFMGTSRMAGRTALFRRLLPAPEELIVEADEHFFTLMPALAVAVILTEPLCFYRLHGGNLYQFSAYDPRRLRLKSNVHTCLARTIPEWLHKLDVPAAAQAVVLEPVVLDARRLHLAAYGGPPASALGVEWRILRHQAKGGHAGPRLTKWPMLVLAAVLPSRWFYRFRAWWSHARQFV